MPNWKRRVKRLAEDFCISQVKVNRICKRIESMYEGKPIPLFYKGNQEAFLYDKAHAEIMQILFA